MKRELTTSEKLNAFEQLLQNFSRTFRARGLCECMDLEEKDWDILVDKRNFLKSEIESLITEQGGGYEWNSTTFIKLDSEQAQKEDIKYFNLFAWVPGLTTPRLEWIEQKIQDLKDFS